MPVMPYTSNPQRNCTGRSLLTTDGRSAGGNDETPHPPRNCCRKSFS